jgi:valyl-tRNA synthetase
MENIRPWCISRQLWWGHRLPVYYCDDCDETIVALAPPERCASCEGSLRQDEDVLDTWFSSSLWPFVTLGWPEHTDALRAFYPTDVLLTARDIIFLWVARMIMMGLRFTGEIPFSDVYVHAVIQAPDGRRMSKSLGTGIDPLVEIDKHGADAVRFGLLAMSSTQDVRYSTEKVKQGERLANKLFNAARFVLLSIGEQRGEAAPEPTAIEDRWILSRLARFQAELDERIGAYDFPRAALGLYDFVYGELCDWYIELVKGRLGEPALDATLRYVLRETLQLAHPMMPFVTEELWQYMGEDGLLAAAVRVPIDTAAAIDDDAEGAVARVIAATTAIRNWRDVLGVKQGQTLQATLDAEGWDEESAALLARIARLELSGGGAGRGGSDGGVSDGGGSEGGASDGGVGRDGGAGSDGVASVAIPGGSLVVLEGVDLGAHEERRERERAKLISEIERLRGKLSNAAFVANAPAELVEREREKLEGLRAELEAL